MKDIPPPKMITLNSIKFNLWTPAKVRKALIISILTKEITQLFNLEKIIIKRIENDEISAKGMMLMYKKISTRNNQTLLIKLSALNEFSINVLLKKGFIIIESRVYLL